MTKQEKAKRKLATRVKLLKASAKVLFDEATNIERELEDLYPPEISKCAGYALSAEEKAKVRAQSMARRGIPINDNN